MFKINLQLFSCYYCGDVCSSSCGGGNCTGNCVGDCEGCGGGCTSCTGNCEPCTGGCTGPCTSSCGGFCQYDCTGSCSGGCSGCSGCGGSCSSSCSGGCDGCSGCGGACSSSCSGGCDGCTGCSGSCNTTCTGTCTGDCNNACTSSNASITIDQLGLNIKINNKITAKDFNDIKSTMIKELERRGKTSSNNYTINPNTDIKILVEHINKIYLDQVISGNPSNAVNVDTIVKASTLQSAVEYTKTLMKQNIKK